LNLDGTKFTVLLAEYFILVEKSLLVTLLHFSLAASGAMELA
jgi:hypothetical protein